MDCRHFDGYIDLYIDDMLDGQEREKFEEHLGLCPECRNNLEDTKKVVSMLGNLDEKSLPEDFRDNLFKGLEKQQPKPSNWLRWVGVVAGIFVIFLSMNALRNTGLMGGMKNAQPMEEMAGDRDQVAGGEEAQSESMALGEGTADPEKNAYADAIRNEQRADDSMEAHDEVPKADGDVDTGSQRGIQSDMVEIYVEDVCITPQTLKFMAINHELELVESDENSVVIEVTDEEQRNILYKELSKMGEVKEVGQETGGNRVKIVIKNKE